MTEQCLSKLIQVQKSPQYLEPTWISLGITSPLAKTNTLLFGLDQTPLDNFPFPNFPPVHKLCMSSKD